MPTLMVRKGLEASCYFEPDRALPPQDESFVRLNYEGYFFCKDEERERFRSDPVAYCGLLTDPVSKRRFRPTPDSPRLEHEGVLFLFQDSDTAYLFAATPGEYQLPGYEMMEDDEQDGLASSDEDEASAEAL